MSRLGTGRAGKVNSCLLLGVGWGIVSGWCFLFSLWEQRTFEIVCMHHFDKLFRKGNSGSPGLNLSDVCVCFPFFIKKIFG